MLSKPGSGTTARRDELSVHDDPDELYRAEFDARELQREIEEAEEKLDRNTRSLADVFIEYMERGDSVEIVVGERRWGGFIIGVSEDLVSLDTGEQRVDVSLEQLALARMVAARESPGRNFAPPEVRSLLARLRELNGPADTAEISIGGPEVLEVGCRLVAVTKSHVEVTTAGGDQMVVPLNAIGFVVTPL